MIDLPTEDGILLGAARAEAYADTERHIAERRARGLFGDLRFTLPTRAARAIPSGSCAAPAP